MLKKQSALIFPIILLAALFGMALVVYSTTLGPGVGGDATIYLTTARNLIAGKGLGWVDADGSYRLLPYTPPFYPLMLSALGLFVKDMVAGARWFNVLLFGLTVVMAGWYFYRYTGRLWLAGILSALIATSPVILGVQVWAMSESLFLFLGFAGLWLLLDYFDSPRWVVLFGSAALCGLAFLTRYMGVAFVVTGGLALLLFGMGEDRRIRVRFNWQTLRTAFFFGFAAIIPILIWLIIDFSLTGTVGSRSGQPAAAYWQRFLEIGPALQNIYLFWLLPDSAIARLPRFAQAALWLVPLAAVIVLGIVFARRLHHSPSADVLPPVSAGAVRLASLFGLLIIVYLVVLAFVQVFTYPPITLASRMLSPVHLAVLVFALALLHLGLRLLLPESRIALAAAFLACLAFLGVYAIRGTAVARGYHGGGMGYTTPAWTESETITRLCQIPANVPLISNETTAIMYLAGRMAYPLYEIYLDHPQPVFSVYGTGKDAAQRVFAEQGGALVLFNSTLYDDFSMYGDRAAERVQALTKGLYPYYQGADGAIYFKHKPTFLAAGSCDEKGR